MFLSHGQECDYSLILNCVYNGKRPNLCTIVFKTRTWYMNLKFMKITQLFRSFGILFNIFMSKLCSWGLNIKQNWLLSKVICTIIWSGPLLSKRKNIFSYVRDTTRLVLMNVSCRTVHLTLHIKAMLDWSMESVSTSRSRGAHPARAPWQSPRPPPPRSNPGPATG